jgi:hypothetical protein
MGWLWRRILDLPRLGTLWLTMSAPRGRLGDPDALSAQVSYRCDLPLTDQGPITQPCPNLIDPNPLLPILPNLSP